MTIGDRFRRLSCSLDDLVQAISDREFDVRYLRNFGHRIALLESCCQAVADLASESFAGRVSCAKVMGRAMELMRDVHGVDVPCGWYPLMKILRSDSQPPLSSRVVEEPTDLDVDEPGK